MAGIRNTVAATGRVVSGAFEVEGDVAQHALLPQVLIGCAVAVEIVGFVMGSIENPVVGLESSEFKEI